MKSRTVIVTLGIRTTTPKKKLKNRDDWQAALDDSSFNSEDSEDYSQVKQVTVSSEESGVILPKGTIVKLQGVPIELDQDTRVASATLEAIGLEAFLNLASQGTADASDLRSDHA